LNYEPHPYVSVGQKVRIKEGVFSGMTGFVVYLKNEQRLILSVQLLMRSVSIEIDRMIVEPIANHDKPAETPQVA
jgi:transcription termination/antitermination protein NusG